MGFAIKSYKYMRALGLPDRVPKRARLRRGGPDSHGSEEADSRS